MAEELLVVLKNRSENNSFGFSLLGKPGLPPIIYNILDDSPAAESGEVEVGDVILKVNETDVNRFTTKEVLKCLRLSSDPVTLKIKRDPKIKATVRKHLLSVSGDGLENRRHARPEPAVHHSKTNGSCGGEQEPLLYDHNGDGNDDDIVSSHSDENNLRRRRPHQHDVDVDDDEEDEDECLQWEPLGSNEMHRTSKQPKFEAYMMTGEHILNISRMPQTPATIVPKQQRKTEIPRYQNSHAHHLRHHYPHHHHPQSSPPHHHNSVPNSPNESELGYRTTSSATTTMTCKSSSTNTSPIARHHITSTATTTISSTTSSSSSAATGDLQRSYVRTSRSEDQLQPGDGAGVALLDRAVAEDDDDVTSSLNTLLDTRESDRIVWTYNAPPALHRPSDGGSLSSQSSGSPSSSSGGGGGGGSSPTSVSSSVMSSSQSGSRRPTMSSSGGGPQMVPSSHPGVNQNGGGDLSVSEAISNISSPDYHDDDSMGMRDCVMMEISDHSDSDSTLLVSEPRQKKSGEVGSSEHRIVIQVKGPDKDNLGKDKMKQTNEIVRTKIEAYNCQISNDVMNEQYLDIEEETTTTREKSSSPQSSEDESDIESLHSFHYSPKAVDLPSAIRLAKRLYSLDGFKKSDVSRHLSKNNDFSRAVAEEYLKYFDFENDTLDIALRKFLKQFSLTGETQERERVLVHFSKRYLDCNPGSFNSQDAVHTLTCAIMLLNTDLHGQNVNRKMTCNEFIENLAGLNECENFPRDILKHLYHAIKNYPLEWVLDEDVDEGTPQMQKNSELLSLGTNPFLDVPILSNAVEYKKGYVMRKCCYEANAKRTPFHKRSWKMFYCTLRDLVLYLHKDENGFRKNQMGDNLHNAIRIHHALATKASDYTKKQYVFRLQTADQAEYLFQTSDSKELQSWIDTINFVCASFSAPPLEAAVGSQKKFQRPLLPCSHTKLNMREQLRDHEERVVRLEAELDEHRRTPPEKGSKSLVIQNYREKEVYLNYELKRYRTYAYMLRSRMSQYLELSVSLVENSIGEVDEGAAAPPVMSMPTSTTNATTGGVTLIENSNATVVPPPVPDRPSPATNRYSYRQAIYNRNMLNGDADIG